MLKYYIYFLKNFKVYNIYTHTHIHTYIHHTPSTSQKISIYIYSYPTQKISKYIHPYSTQKISKCIYIYTRKNIPVPPKKFQSVYIYTNEKIYLFHPKNFKAYIYIHVPHTHLHNAYLTRKKKYTQRGLEKIQYLIYIMHI